MSTFTLTTWRRQIERAPLGRRDLAVLRILAGWIMRHPAGAFRSVDDLMAATGYSRRSIKYALAALRAAGWIAAVAHAQGGRGLATEYVAALPGIGAWSEPGKGAKTDPERVQKLHPSSSELPRRAYGVSSSARGNPGFADIDALEWVEIAAVGGGTVWAVRPRSQLEAAP